VTDNIQLYKSLLRIRRFEETVLENFPKGVFLGTTHTYIGEEADAVGILSAIDDEDIVFSNHRCHGHFLAYGGDMRSLFAELMGKATGVCGGRGGSQHLKWKNFYTNGIQGGIVPIATGMALAEKYKSTHAIVINFLGDGTLGEGIIYESFNMAKLWETPILYIVENNQIAQTTPVNLALAGSIQKRFEAFDIPTSVIDSSDVLEIKSIAAKLIQKTREYQTPHALVIHTCRFAPHSKSDDTRPQEEIEEIRLNRDPIKIHGARIQTQTQLEIAKDVNTEISKAFSQALQDPVPTLKNLNIGDN